MSELSVRQLLVVDQGDVPTLVGMLAFSDVVRAHAKVVHAGDAHGESHQPQPSP